MFQFVSDIKNHHFLKSNIKLMVMGLALLIIEVFFRLYYSIEKVGNLFESLAYICFLLLVVRYAKHKLTCYIACGVVFFSYLLQYGHYAIYRSWLSSVEIYLFFEKFNEVILSSKDLFIPLAIPLCISIVLLFMMLALIRTRTECGLKKYFIVDVALLMFLIMPVAQAALSKSIQDSAPNLRYSAIKANYKVFGYFLAKTLPHQIFGLGSIPQWKRESPVPDKNWDIKKSSVKNIILIMGESQNVDNVSVFGYPKNTTPFLSAMRGHAVIKKTFASGTFTDVALPTFFNMIERPDGTRHIFTWKSNVFRLAQAHGYETHFISAQARDSMALMSRVGLQYINDFKDPVSLGYDAKVSMRDHELLGLFDKIDLSKGNHFIVLHQIGSHAPYSERTDVNEKVFGTETLEDEYNNSVLKTDSLIKAVYGKLMQQAGKDWLFIYTSDHGQYVKDGAFGHGSLKNKSHYMVPSVIFTNNIELQSKTDRIFSKCDKLYQLQLSTFIVNVMGYNEDVKDCKSGVVNGSRLDGSAGFKVIEQ